MFFSHTHSSVENNKCSWPACKGSNPVGWTPFSMSRIIGGRGLGHVIGPEWFSILIPILTHSITWMADISHFYMFICHWFSITMLVDHRCWRPPQSNHYQCNSPWLYNHVPMKQDLKELYHLQSRWSWYNSHRHVRPSHQPPNFWGS